MSTNQILRPPPAPARQLSLPRVIAGLAMRAPALLAAGYLAHGLWDIVHGPRGIHTRIPWWYAPLCIGFDTVVGAYLLIAF